jgi:hypothetical protein
MQASQRSGYLSYFYSLGLDFEYQPGSCNWSFLLFSSIPQYKWWYGFSNWATTDSSLILSNLLLIYPVIRRHIVWGTGTVINKPYVRQKINTYVGWAGSQRLDKSRDEFCLNYELNLTYTKETWTLSTTFTVHAYLQI